MTTTTPQPRAETGAETASPRPAVRIRMHFVDNLRVYLTVLVLAHHLALTYGNIPAWTYLEPPDNPAEGRPLDVLVALNQMFFMGFFFLIAGYFTPGSLDRKGSRTFARDRLKRLGIPLLGFLILLRPLFMLPLYLGMPADERPAYPLFYVFSVDPEPLWFVEVLLVFSLVYAWFRSRRPAPAPPIDKQAGPPQMWQIIAYAVGLGVVSYLWRILVPIGLYIPVLGLPSAAFLPQYTSMFALGVIAYRRGWFEKIPGRYAVLGALLAAASFVSNALAMTGGTDSTPTRGSLTNNLYAVLGESLFVVGVILVLFTLFRRFLNRQGRFAAYLSRNAFAVYVIHPVVLVGTGVALSGIDLPAVPKFGLALLVAAPAWTGVPPAL